MVTLYHVSDKEFLEGTIIPQGKWSETKDESINFERELIEEVFENIRKEFSPKLISRFNCIFAFKDLEYARLFKKMYRPNGFIYEIEIDNKTLTFEGDFSIRTWINQPTINKIKQSAKDYWNGVRHTNFIETLMGGSVKVIRKVE